MKRRRLIGGCKSTHPSDLVEGFEKTEIIPKELPALKVDTPPIIDGKLDDICWLSAPMADDFTDRNTGGKPAINQSEVQLVYTEKAIYISWFLFDDKPNEIVIHQTEDQERILREDWVSFTIDPFHIHQPEYRTYFKVNPHGKKYINRPPKNVVKDDVSKLWKVAANIVDEGWVVEMEIPWTLFVYPKIEVPITMGINFERMHRRTGEHSWWSKVGFISDDRPDGHWKNVIPPK